MINILVLAANAGLTQLIESMPDHDATVLSRDDVDHLARQDGLSGLIQLNAGITPDIVIFGDEVPLGESLSIANLLDTELPGVELMLVADADAEIALRAMRVGVREIVEPTIGQDELKVLLHRASGNVSSRLKPHLTAGADAMVQRSRVIVVVSSKGGVGKSTIAANLAVGIARMAPMETVLVDLDVQFGDAATLLDLTPSHSIADAFGSSAALDTLVLKTFLTMHPAKLYILAGADSPTVSDHVTAAHVKRLLEQLSSQFRYVVVDTGAGLSEHTLAALELANDAIIVSSMDVASIRSVRKEVDVLAELNLLPPSRHLVLNMADQHSGLTSRDVEAVVGMPVAVTVPRSQDVPLAGNHGEPILLAKKPGAAGKALDSLVRRLAEPTQEAAEATGKRRGMRAAKRGARRS